MRQLLALVMIVVLVSGCGRKHRGNESEYAADEIPELDTAQPIADTVHAVAEEAPEPLDYEEPQYQGGILPVIEAEVPEYAERLATEGRDGFIIVDKARMKVLLYDQYGNVSRDYDMACAKNYGNKRKKADNRTPEGYFSVVGVYDSTEWLYTDDNGKQSKKKGQFGPRFIRINSPQIGIHGTVAPWSIGHRVSHGCIRITNENIMELQGLVHAGMPVIILPGKRDREVNRKEGMDVPYFATNPKYELSASERKRLDDVLKKEQSVDSVAVVVADEVDASMDSITMDQEKTEVAKPDTLPAME